MLLSTSFVDGPLHQATGYFKSVLSLNKNLFSMALINLRNYTITVVLIAVLSYWRGSNIYNSQQNAQSKNNLINSVRANVANNKELHINKK